ncbi:hypothetical protein NS44R_14610 [Mammaliicoccus sciuri]|nr:hypothetical protein NS44R_14610 [Mammaliicoccus sciuri]
MISEAEIALLQAIVPDQVGGGALEHDATAADQDHPPARHHGARRTLLDDQEGELAQCPQPQQDLVDLVDDLRREAERRLVDGHDAGRGHQRAADHQHLLLAAGEHARRGVAALGQPRAFLVDLIEVVGDCPAVGAHRGADLPVLLDR